MNEAIIENWNNVIKPNDIVYHLGDVMLGADLEGGMQILSRLDGIKYLAFGNHDSNRRISEFAKNNIFKQISLGYRLTIHKKCLVLSHYPQLVANKDDPHPVYTIHGHTHSKDRWSDVFHAYNVNMDAHNCTPVNIEEMIKEIKSHTF